MAGVDEDDLDNLPEHLQPSDDEIVTDGGVPEARLIADAPDDGDLTRYQWEILYILAVKRDQADYGLGIKRSLEAYYGEDMTHGRLYPNLDDLVERDLVAKSAADKRTNNYTLTDDGATLLRQDVERKQDAVDAIGGGQ